ncbi:MAG: hypothetical protein IPK97_13360 [Ahniella sp.]|nr:hypothetical protein [Ahniella sp.]
MSIYLQTIREALARTGRAGAADPRHVEAWMRLEHGCLDGLSRQQFTEEVTIALQCVAAAPAADSEALAASFGL